MNPLSKLREAGSLYSDEESLKPHWSHLENLCNQSNFSLSYYFSNEQQALVSDGVNVNCQMLM
jgi:hypothetical protein